MIALGTLTLLEHPHAWQRLSETDDPALVANIVEELMRSLVARVALEDMIIGGQWVRACEALFTILPAGNWDPTLRCRLPSPTTVTVTRTARFELQKRRAFSQTSEHLRSTPG
jgi:cytochrome P450